MKQIKLAFVLLTIMIVLGNWVESTDTFNIIDNQLEP